MTECMHPNSVTSDINRSGVIVEVTDCPDCGAELDSRALKEAERVAATRKIPPKEAAIQSQARIDKAEEIGMPGLAAKLREESGEMDALPVALAVPDRAEGLVMEVIRSKEALLANTPTGKQGDDLHQVCAQAYAQVLLEPAPCTKQGGEFVACDTGSGKAHHCTNSKWGKTGTFGGPCRCYTCHELGDALA